MVQPYLIKVNMGHVSYIKMQGLTLIFQQCVCVCMKMYALTTVREQIEFSLLYLTDHHQKGHKCFHYTTTKKDTNVFIIPSPKRALDKWEGNEAGARAQVDPYQCTCLTETVIELYEKSIRNL